MVRKAQLFKVSSLMELVRLIVSNSQARGGYLYYSEKDGKTVFAVSHLVPGWYNLRGLPITMYAEHNTPVNGNFIQYNFATEDSTESFQFTNYNSNNSKIMFIPLIKVDEFPEFFF